MIIYLAVFFLLILASNSQRRSVLALSCVILVLILGLRDENIGTDTRSYNDLFRTMTEEYRAVEIGWRNLVFLTRDLGWSATAYNFMIAVFTVLPIGWVAKKELDNPTGALFVYYMMGLYFAAFNVMRQSFAMGITFVAIYLYIHDKGGVSALLILLASLFHTSALVTFLIFFVEYIRVSQSKVLLALGLTAVLGLVLPTSALEIIAGDDYSGIVRDYSRQNFLAMVVYLVFTDVLFLYAWEKSKELQMDDRWIKIYLISVLLFNVFIQTSEAMRISFYFSMAQLIVLPKLWKTSLNYRIVIFTFCILFFAKNMISYSSKWGEDGSMAPYVVSKEFTKNM